MMWKKFLAYFLFVFAVFYTVVELFIEKDGFKFYIPIIAITFGITMLKEQKKNKG